jgi:UTP-glucose-1-phosphate uridylyltransferase
VAEPVTVEELKDQLRLSLVRTDEDGHLGRLIASARRSIEKATQQVIVGDAVTLPEQDLPIVQQAILMLASHWYDVRDATGDMPASVLSLVSPLRRWSA